VSEPFRGGSDLQLQQQEHNAESSLHIQERKSCREAAKKVVM